MSLFSRTTHPAPRALKFRQAAIVYLHYAVLYEVGAWMLLQRGMFPATRGPEWVWFAAGAGIAALVIAGLWWWQNVWFSRVIWVFVALRLPTLLEGVLRQRARGAADPLRGGRPRRADQPVGAGSRGVGRLSPRLR